MTKKKTIGMIATVLAFILISALVIGRVYNVLRWKDTTGDYVSSLKQLYNTDDNLVDLVFVGSSHTYCAVYPCFFWEKYGISAFDMSVSGQDKISALYHLEELFKTQRPKAIFVDLYALCYDKGAVEGNYYRNLLAMDPSINSFKHAIEYCDKEETMDYIMRWPIIHTRYRELKTYDFYSYKPNDYIRGEGISFGVEPNAQLGDIRLNETDCVTLADENKEWIDRLKAMSEKYDFALNLMVLPYCISESDRKIYDAARVYAEEKGIDYYDLNKLDQEIGLEASSDYSDVFHLNAFGAYKMSSYLADLVHEKYELTDHRGDSAYGQWDLDLEYYYHRLYGNQLAQCSDPGAFFRYLSNLQDDVKIFISCEVYDKDPYTYAELLSKYGIEIDALSKGGVWMIDKDGLSDIYKYDPNAEPKVIRLSEKDTLEIKYNGTGSVGNLRIGYEEYSNHGTELTFLIYDELIGDVLLFKQY